MSFTVDSQVGSSTNWLQDARKPDLRVRLLRLYVLFALLIVAGAILYTLIARRQIETAVRSADLALVNTLAAQIMSLQEGASLEAEVLPWLKIAGVEETAVLTLVSPDREILASVEQDFNLPATSDWQAWQQRIMRTVLLSDSGNFTTLDPEGETWLHSFTTLNENAGRIILQRPTAVAYAQTRQLYRGILLTIAVFLAGGLFSWFLLSIFVIKPLEKLEAFSSRLRWRSQHSPEELVQIEAIARREDQIGNLSRALLVMKKDTEKQFVQLSTLLETSKAVASSLDATEVIENILDQVQNLFGVERCAVVILDIRGDVFRIRASRGFSEPYVRQLRIDPAEPNSPSMRALKNQIPIQVSDTETDLAFAGFRHRSRAQGFRSVLAIPLKTQHAPPAVLLLYKTEPYRYSYSEIELASSFAHNASIALENAALYALTDERLQEQTRRLEAIVESLDDGLILESTVGQVLFCNQRALDLLGLRRQNAHGAATAVLMQKLFSKAVDPQTAVQALANMRANERPSPIELTLQLEYGRLRDVRVQFFDVTDANGDLLGRGQIWQDITKDKEIDRMKTALLSTVSHELRTPLATIKGYVSTLLADDVQWDEAAQQEFLAAISHETDRLTLLVKNLLDMSRIEAGILQIHCEQYTVNDLLNQIIHSLQPQLKQRLRLQLDSNLPPIWMDVPRIGTVIRNLVENAEKYSPSDATIDLSTTRDNGAVLFSVRDYGPGVPVALQGKIFDRFYRVENGWTRRVGGVGLGLAICKGFVEAHHGKIWVESAQAGAIFRVSLPIERRCKD